MVAASNRAKVTRRKFAVKVYAIIRKFSFHFFVVSRLRNRALPVGLELLVGASWKYFNVNSAIEL
jgi:hypothetical protein